MAKQFHSWRTKLEQMMGLDWRKLTLNIYFILRVLGVEAAFTKWALVALLESELHRNVDSSMASLLLSRVASVVGVDESVAPAFVGTTILEFLSGHHHGCLPRARTWIYRSFRNTATDCHPK